jgi:hypothetical protein
MFLKADLKRNIASATMNERDSISLRDLVKSGNSLIKKWQTVNILLGVEYENFNEIL